MMSDFIDLLEVIPVSNFTAPGLLYGLSTAANSATAGNNHLAGLAQLAVLALLAFPIWLFGLLIGILLPKGTFSIGDSHATDDVSSNSSSRVGVISRPLSDDELSESESEPDDAGLAQPRTAAALHRVPAKYEAAKPILSESVKPLAGLSGAAGRMMAAAADRASHTITFAQQLVAQPAQPGSKHLLSPSGPSTPDGSYSASSGAKDHKVPDDLLPAVREQNVDTQRHHHRHRHHQHAARASPADSTPAGSAAPASRHLRPSGSGSSDRSRSFSGPHSGHHWFVTEDDLDKFVEAVTPVQDKLTTGNIGPGWNLIMDKEVPGVVRYLSYWRPTDNGTTDYLSVTILPDATAQEVHEFNLDDVCRSRWDPMLAKTWLLSSRDLSADEQLVIWLRSFPMGFLSDRLYAGIARRTFKDPEEPHSTLYGVTKVVKTPTATAWAGDHYPGTTQNDNYFSAWRCRTIPSPWESDTQGANSNSSTGSLGDGMPNLAIKTGAESDVGAGPAAGAYGNKPACELILYHHDELKVPEYLSRMAVKMGMWKFVTGMVDAASTWLEQRRAHCDPFIPDPQAACRQPAPPLSGSAAAAAAAAAVPESPFSPMARQGFAPTFTAAAAPGGSDDIDAADLLMSPRRLYAVPTAPDLIPLAAVAEGDDNGTEDVFSPAAAAARLVSFSDSGAAGHRTSGLRRGHSLEWEPRPDATAVITPRQGGKAACKDGTVTDKGAAQQQVQQQTQLQRKFGFGPVQFQLPAVPQHLKGVAGVASAVQSVISRLPGAVSDAVRGLAQKVDQGMTGGQGGAVATAGASDGEGLGQQAMAASTTAAGLGIPPVKTVRIATADVDNSAASSQEISHQQDKRDGAGPQSRRQPGSRQPLSKVQAGQRFVLRGVVVCAAGAMVKLLVAGGRHDSAAAKVQRKQRGRK